MAKLGQIKSGTMRVGNTTTTGYGIVYADEIIGHRRVAKYSDLNNIPDWCLYNKAGGDTPSTAVGQLWYVSTSETVQPSKDAAAITYSNGLYQLVAYDGTTKKWERFKNGSDVVTSDTTYTFANGTDGSFTVTPKGGDTQKVTIGKPASASSADSATKATNDGNGNNIANTYLTKTTASSTYATKSDVTALTSALVYKGTVDATYALPTTSVKVGDVYVVAAAGTYAGQACENGDMIIASSTTPTWTVVQANINGAVTSRSTLDSNAIVLGDGNRSVKTFATTSTAGYLYWTGTAYAWKTPSEFSLKAASADSLGGIKIGYTATGKNYPVQLDANSKAYVNIPWVDNTENVETITNYLKNNGVIDFSTQDNAFTATSFKSQVIIGLSCNKLGNDGATQGIGATIPAATSEKAGVMTATDKQKLDALQNIPTIALADIDTCGYKDATALCTAIVNKEISKVYVTELAAYMTLSTDNMAHAIVQTVTTHNQLDTKTWQFVDNIHQDGVLYTYQRYYPFGGTYGNISSSILNKWTPWLITNVDGMFYEASGDQTASNYNTLLYQHAQKYANVSTNNNVVSFIDVYVDHIGLIKSRTVTIAEPISDASITNAFK